MHLIIIAVVVVSVIGLIAGLGLAVASKVMAVPVDEKAEEIQAALPGANCGACGFSGCSGYAAALSEGIHILGSVDQQRGCCEVTEGKYEITIYTSCCNTAKGIYYYTTYDNHQITAVDMHAENLDSDQLICYPLLSKGEVRWQNK